MAISNNALGTNWAHALGLNPAHVRSLRVDIEAGDAPAVVQAELLNADALLIDADTLRVPTAYETLHAYALSIDLRLRALEAQIAAAQADS